RRPPKGAHNQPTGFRTIDGKSITVARQRGSCTPPTVSIPNCRKAASLECLRVTPRSSGFILRGKDGGLLQWPVNTEMRVIPNDRPLILRHPEIGRLIKNLRRFGKNKKAMREAFGNPKLLLILRRQRLGYPFAEGRRTSANIHCYVEDLALHNT